MAASKIWAASLLLLGLLWSARAAAFCRTTTAPIVPTPAGQCPSGGFNLYWASSCVSYDVQQDGSQWATYDQASAVADAAFQSWATAPCPGTTATPSITFTNMGPVMCDQQQYNDQSHSWGGNANIIIFHDTEWNATTASDPSSTLALTTVTFNLDTGEIYDADIEINGMTQISITTPVPSDAHDLQSILTHESGHFLGLAHSLEACSSDGSDCPTMNPYYQLGSDAYRTLEADDIAGVCAIYPPGRQTTSDSCTPRHGFGSQCGSTTPPPSTSSCSLAPGDGSPGRASQAALVMVGLLIAAARGRRPRGRVREGRRPS